MTKLDGRCRLEGSRDPGPSYCSSDLFPVALVGRVESSLPNGPIQYQIAAIVDDLRDLALSFMVHGFFATGGGVAEAKE
jgi:hypothetical protein